MSDDGCGGILACGDPAWAGNCPPGSVCSFNKTCVEPPDVCVPKPKCLYKECGFEDDGCKGKVACGPNGDGTCAGGENCLLNGLTCTPDCVPQTQCDSGYKCGTQDNQCGKQILCGECNSGYYCDVDAATNTSACAPVPSPPCVPTITTCGAQKCGQVMDDCGQVIDCPGCPFGQVRL